MMKFADLCFIELRAFETGASDKGDQMDRAKRIQLALKSVMMGYDCSCGCNG